MAILRFAIPLLVFIYAGALFSIYPSIREALIDLDSIHDQKWGERSPDSLYFLEGHLWLDPVRLAIRILPSSHWSALLLALLLASAATFSILSRIPSASEWVLHLGLALNACILGSIAAVFGVHGMMMDGMTPFTPGQRAVDAAWILAFALVLSLIFRDWLRARLQRRHEAVMKSASDPR